VLKGSVTSARIVSLPVIVKGEAMAQAFRSGQLPSPLPRPGGDPEHAAADLAKQVMAADA
jgi:hypothetical protein